MKLKLYNTLTRRIGEFVPLKKGRVGFYSCGPTVHNYAHLGNLRAYVFADLLKRALLFNGYKVKHVMNITDVGHLTSDEDTGEDKVEEGARREGKRAEEIAEFYTEAFKNDLKRLNILAPNIWCRASEHIEEQLDLIKRIEKKGFSYRLGDGIYFDTSRLKDYGKLARLNIAGLKAGARVEVIKGKKNITDFALWKFSPQGKKRQQEWDSPWGKGFPGWHLECTAMAMKYLGERFDIHSGGIDHIPVHHTNEIAQAEAATGKKWVNFWLHGEFLVLEKEKMAKSTGNFITLNTLIEKGIDPLAYRYFLLNAHYRSPLVFSWEIIENARKSFQGFKKKAVSLRQEAARGKKESVERELFLFIEKINNDLNIPQALAYTWEIMRETSLSAKAKYLFLKEADKVLGFNIDEFREEEIELSQEIERLIKERQAARKNKDFKKADQLRDEILKKGIILEDTPEGVRWRKK